MLLLFVRRPRSICSGLPLIGKFTHEKLEWEKYWRIRQIDCYSQYFTYIRTLS